MTAIREHGALYFECDDCEESEEADADDFQGSWEELKEEGWRCTKEGSTWQHFCPDCVRAWARRRERDEGFT